MTRVHTPAGSVQAGDTGVDDNGSALWTAVEDAVVEHGFARFAIRGDEAGPLRILTIEAGSVVTVERRPGPLRSIR